MLKTSISKTRRPFGQPVADAKGHPRYVKIPKAPPQTLVLPLETVMPGISDQLAKAKKLVFHTVGDTGPIKGDEVIKLVAGEMEAQFAGAPKLGDQATLDPDKLTAPDPADGDPSFFYHLGDVVYFNGLARDYQAQFYEPYQFYPAQIFAIAGNHDGDTRTQKNDPVDDEPSLTGFFENFCAPERQYLSAYRPTMTQPYVYWTLDTPFATIIGLYSNVDGSLDPTGVSQQQAWFEQQLKAADKNKCLILAVHHPCYSLDDDHGGYPDIFAAIQDAAAKADDRWPDIVLSGHVHNYQRFTQKLNDGRQIPHLVIGDGGYADTVKAMHKLQRDPAHNNAAITKPFQTDVKGVTLESYNEIAGGFGRITVDSKNLAFEYFVCPLTGPTPTTPFDAFTLNWKTQKITDSKPGFGVDSGAKTVTHAKRRGAGKNPQGWPATGPNRDRKPRL
jgi:predicted phosphodiesterase